MGFRRSYLRWRAYTNGSAPCKVITSATSALSGASLPLQELWSRARVWGRTAKMARDFRSESVYERFRALQGYHFRNIGFVRRELAIAGTLEPGKGLGQDGKDRTGFEQSRADMSYWDLVFQNVRALPSNFWPPAEYEWKYSAEKITDPGRSRDNRQDEVPELAEEGEGQDTLGGLAMRTLPFQDEVRLRRISGDAAPGRRPNVR